MYEVLEYIKIVYIIGVLIYFSILDILYRDVPDKLAWGSLAVSFILGLASIPLYFRYSSDLVILYSVMSMFLGPGIMYGLYKMGLMGGADVIVLTDIAVLFPLPTIYEVIVTPFNQALIPLRLPPILPILLYANLSVLIVIPFNIVYNLVKYHRFYSKLNISISKKIILLATAKPVKANDYLKLKHRYLLEEFNIDGGTLVRSPRTTFDISEEYTDHQELIRNLLEKGYLKPEDRVLVTYGIPYIVPILLGLIIFLVFGDSLVARLLLALG